MLVFDATCLSHFALAERLDVLHDLVLDDECRTTDVVRDELRQGLSTHPALRDAIEADWLVPARLDTIEELQCFAKWCRRIGGEPRNRGESSVFAAVERHGGVAITETIATRCASAVPTVCPCTGRSGSSPELAAPGRSPKSVRATSSNASAKPG
ncbi:MULTISPECIES: hypothetical protein [Amycolatopsis]|uniref:PIN domain-containing protein n=1 Tax=Amycolatopsis tucumanensis TaxID=401106 RepID=A0ABP7J5X6_9PSEU|nr:hypothetical protein [Amycolatopsis tucumanensis]MCF6423279.1 hypothetical protein [Amycolatopsis tucumanensis]